MLVYGPVPSRRLGRSVGINNIPPKFCTYSCIYCQLGRTNNMQVKRQSFYDPGEIFDEVKQKIIAAEENKEVIDYITFVADGEPTLDINLGEEIDLLKKTDIKIGVITNSSLIWQKEVRRDLEKADWVSLKIDTVSDVIWHKIDRPFGSLKLDRILEGIIDFSKVFDGELVTETMLIANVNEEKEELERISDFILEVDPKKSFISVPIRPPAEKWVKPVSKYNLNIAYQIFKDKQLDVEFLISSEGDNFGFTGDVENDILSITSVHPMRQKAVRKFLIKAKADWDVIETLLKKGELKEIDFDGEKFYIRNF